MKAILILLINIRFSFVLLIEVQRYALIINNKHVSIKDFMGMKSIIFTINILLWIYQMIIIILR